MDGILGIVICIILLVSVLLVRLCSIEIDGI
jgi:hypothetical protein